MPNLDQFLYYFFIITTNLIIFGGVIFIIFLISKNFKNRKKLQWAKEQKYTMLLVSVPKDNEKSPLAAEQMFASLHGIYKNQEELNAERAIQEHFSFEIISIDKFIRFYIYTPRRLKEFIEGQIYAQYPTVEIQEIKDYIPPMKKTGSNFAATELAMTKPDFFPIKTFLNFEVDPLAGITGALSEIQSGEQIWIQVLAKPASDDWQANGISHVENVRAGETPGGPILKQLLSGIWGIAKEIVSTLLKPPPPEGQAKPVPKEEIQLPTPIEEGLKAVETKVTKLGFETKIRIVSWSDNEAAARAKLHTTIGAFKQYNVSNLNGFIAGKVSSNDSKFLDNYQARLFNDEGFIFNIEELASIFHLPSISVETPHIVWAGSKKSEPPANLPIIDNYTKDDLTILAKTDFRNVATDFGLKDDDRRRHLYTIGKTGVGKTTMLENMAIRDIRAGNGVAVVDPHGDFVDRILDFIPEDRIDDVIYFDPSDTDNPIGFNLLEKVNPELKSVVTSGLVGIFHKIWAYTWGPRLEHILRNTIMALLDYPDSTLLGVLKMLSDKNFRLKVVEKVQDPVVKEFWLQEFEGYNDRLRSEAVAPIQNKVGQFVSSSTIRNIIGQPESTIDMQDIMDKGKILLINLSKGKIGEDNSALLGAMMITKIQLSAMNRANIPEEKRKDFYLYVDEFQNFATESFSTIFSEARKYKLNIIVANQYIAQMPEEVREAIFGNVGTIISFRVGAADAPFLAKEFSPVFEENDLVNLDKFRVYIKMAIDGITSPGFSAITLPPPVDKEGNRLQIVATSRQKYSKPKDQVEEQIAKWSQEESKLAVRDIVKDKQEPEQEKSKGPSAILKIQGKKIAEYSDQEGNKWYQSTEDEKDTPQINKVVTQQKTQPDQKEHDIRPPEIKPPDIKPPNIRPPKIESEKKDLSVDRQSKKTPQYKTNGSGNGFVELKEGKIVKLKE